MARKPLPLAEQTEIPIQPVAKPILCSPFAEPGQHWVYDTHTGEARQGTRTGPGQASSSAALGQCGQLLGPARAVGVSRLPGLAASNRRDS
ncbi:MAG TPA: hypothetical protein PKY50_15005 [Candidatus Competibacter sp.]|nr:hypothetical protein [Candidatus Competibacter sp.]